MTLIYLLLVIVYSVGIDLLRNIIRKECGMFVAQTHFAKNTTRMRILEAH